MTENYKDVTDTGLADLLRRNVSALAVILQECKERGLMVSVRARQFKPQLQYMITQPTPEFTEHDSPVVASITRTKSETF